MNALIKEGQLNIEVKCSWCGCEDPKIVYTTTLVSSSGGRDYCINTQCREYIDQYRQSGETDLSNGVPYYYAKVLQQQEKDSVLTCDMCDRTGCEVISIEHTYWDNKHYSPKYHCFCKNAECYRDYKKYMQVLWRIEHTRMPISDQKKNVCICERMKSVTITATGPPGIIRF